VKRGRLHKEGRDRFRAYSIPCEDASDAQTKLDALMEKENLNTASHLSWALRTSNQGRTDEIKNDGGEKGAGNCILDILRKREVINILVLVARWYGGRHLGPKRFRIYRRLTGELF
jgi:putative IMPACT (imprinted ancient) family translation regulator